MYILLEKALAGIIIEQEKLRIPHKDCICLSVTDLDLRKSSISLIVLVILSEGRLAIIATVSSCIPKKGSEVRGP